MHELLNLFFAFCLGKLKVLKLVCNVLPLTKMLLKMTDGGSSNWRLRIATCLHIRAFLLVFHLAFHVSSKHATHLGSATL